uniref:Ig-like domain-containing protein n=1 Tax=Latimeria chalumnae TaxID=7897 RepID=H3AJ79_LATCH
TMLCSTDVQHFGPGTKLTVLGDNHEIQEPKVTLFEPSKDELKKKKKATLVCLATDFYPDHISLAWYLNGKELEEGFKTDDEATSETESTNKTQNTLYYISSRLRVPLKTWLNPENEFTCLVHFDPTDKNFTQSTRGKGACGVTPESFKQGAKTGTLSYVLLMSKSAAYAVFILFLAWKMKKRKKNN